MRTAAFPRVPEVARRAVPDGTALRRFGTDPADLDLDFAARRAELTDALVAACTEPTLAGATAARLPISVRIRALLRIAAAEAPVAELGCACGCGEQLEVALPLADVAADPPRVVDEVEVAGRRIRVPTGEHQRAAEAVAAAGPLAVARALVGEPALAEAELPALDAALDAADPLVAFHVTARCPACGAAVRHDVDLEALAHRLLAGAQQRLLDEIHRLALAYHWTERDVLALTARRRAHYLARVNGGER